MISKNLIIKMNIDIDLNYTFNIDIILRFEHSRLYKHREDDTMFISKQNYMKSYNMLHQEHLPT